MGKEKKQQRNKHGWSLLVTAGFLVLFFVLTAEISTVAINVRYKDKILPGVSIGKINIGGLTEKEAHTRIQKEVDSIKQKGLTFCYEKHCTIIDSLLIAPADLDLAYNVIDTDVKMMIEKAMGIGKTENHLTRLFTQVKTLKSGNAINMEWITNEEELEHTLKENFEKRIARAKNTEIIINDNGDISIAKAIDGEILEYKKAITEAKGGLEKLDSPQVIMSVSIEKPEITKIDEEKIIKDVTNAIENQKWELAHNDDTWIISRSDKQRLLSLQIDESGEVSLGLREDVFLGIIEGIAGSVEHAMRDAKFELKNGRVGEFQNSRDGTTIVREETIKNAQSVVKKSTSSSEVKLTLVVELVKSSVPTESVNDLGIKELIGVGHSNFSGSPVNRRHNIAIGANTLHGLLIAPEEEFSLINALGEIDANQGYREELVIKGNETIPEFGGGLCQIGTTAFRVAMESGMPITERRNHSYRVRYYEPAGTDATIYGPHPDFRFVNDTGHHILIQTRIEGSDIYFEFWGTDDGRIAKQTKPVVYNITTPPPTKYIETLDLPVGEIKCTERAHNGADTTFDYSVTYEDGQIKKDTFNSHYRAWQEVCLKGVEVLTENIDELENKITSPEGEAINSLN